MIPQLAPLFAGELAPFAQALHLGTAEGEEPGALLLSPAALDVRLAAFSRRWPNPDPRAAASVWAKHHFSNVLTPVLAANLLMDIELPTALSDIGIVSAADGTTAALVLPHLGGPAPAGIARFLPLMEGHVRPLVTALAGLRGLSAKVLWSNFGNQFEALIQRAAALGVPAAADGRELMALRRLPGGAPNPLFEPIRYVAGERLRRVCCLRYLIPELDYCSTCPLEQARRP